MCADVVIADVEPKTAERSPGGTKTGRWFSRWKSASARENSEIGDASPQSFHDQRSIMEGLEQVFAHFGGVGAVFEPHARISIKPNAVHFSPQTFTDAAVLEGMLAYLRDHGYEQLDVMENATGGNFTRLVFHVNGYKRLCKRYSARPVYLDEGPTTAVRLRDEDEETRISKWLYERLVVGPRDGHYYLSLPKLKTHSMSTVTLGVKNQQAFPVHADRIHRHNRWTLHHRLAALYDLIKPDFCIVEGLSATINGHFPATALVEQSKVDLNVLIGGPDTLAVDTVGARVLGYDVDEIPHLTLCRDWGLGVADLDEIEVVGAPLSRFRERYPYKLLGKNHPDVVIIEGRNACEEGCKGNSMCIQEMLTNDFNGRGRWTLIFGGDVDEAELEPVVGLILVVGPCAVSQLRAILEQRFRDRRLFFVEACNDLTKNSTYQAHLMKVIPVKMVPVNPITSAWLLMQARLHRTTARLPPIFGLLR